MIQPTGGEVSATDRDERLGEAIEAYLELAENGHPPDPDRFVKRYPDLEEDLRAAIDGLELVRGLVGSSSGPGPGHGLESGRRVAGYKIVRELGRGGMGIVYEAVHVGLDRPVALKVLGASAAPDSSGRRRFLNEARTAAALHHTHIVPVFDVGQVGGLCYYAMQRIEGSGLDRVIKRLRRDRPVAAGSNSASNKLVPTVPESSPLSESRPRHGSTASWGGALSDATRSRINGLDTSPATRQNEDEEPPFLPPKGLAYYRWVASVGMQAADALAHAHQRGVIHRDVKPSNLLIDARGMIWMADFGLARRLADPSQTQVDSLLGTPRYMSPEQTKTGPIDGRTDVYSLGATLYELLTLRPPFDGTTAAELVDQINGREPVHPRQFDRRIPLDLETIILKALAKRPADRYETAQEFSEDLERFLSFEPVKARRISPLGRAWRVARRHPSLTLVSTIALIAVTAAWTTAYYRVVWERDDAVQARKDAQEAAQKTHLANQATRLALRNQSYQQATLQRLSNVANRRASGLGFIKEAASLEPDPAFTVQLRDEAMALLSLRDVVVRKTVVAERNSGFLALDENRLGLLSDFDDGTLFRIQDLTKNDPSGGLQDAFEIDRSRPEPGDGRPEGDRSRQRGGGRGPGGPPPGFRYPRAVSLGSRVAALLPNGKGIRLFDAETGTVVGTIPLANRMLIGLYAVSNGKRLVTIELESPGINEGSPPPFSGMSDRMGRNSVRFQVNLWEPERAEAPVATLAVSKPEAPSAPPQMNAAANPGFTGIPIPLVAAAPDGDTIAVGWSNNNEITFFGTNGKKRDTIDIQLPLMGMVLGPNDLLATLGNGMVQVWDLTTKSPRASLTPHHSAVAQIRFSPDSRALLAIALRGGSVELWDMTISTSSPIAVLPTSEYINQIAFSPTGRSLVVGQGDSVAVWSVLDPVGQVQLGSLGGRVNGLDFGPGGRLVLWSQDANPRYWKPGECMLSGEKGPLLPPGIMAFDGRGRLISVDDTRLRLSNADTGIAEVDLPLPKLRGEVAWKGFKPIIGRSIAHTPDGQFVAFTRGGELLAWSGQQPDRIRRVELMDPNARPMRGPGGPQSSRGGNLFYWGSLAVAPSGDRIYGLTPISRTEYEFRAYELDSPMTGSTAQRLLWKPNEDGRFTAMAMSNDGRWIALGERSGRVLLLSAESGRVVESLYPPEGDGEHQVASLAFARDGSMLAVGSRENVRLWSLQPRRSARPLVRLPGHRGVVGLLTFDSEGHHLASGDDKITRVWDLDRVRDEMSKLGLGF